ncbi:hypothetical protein BaRGS_00018995, partial [Batillaria attramentaria]
DLASLTASGGHHSNTTGGGHSHAHGSKRVSEHELHKRSDRDINLQVFKTHEEIRNVERQMDKLRESLARNENKDRNMAAQVRSRLSEQEAYLASLKSSSTALEKHQRKRTDNKKLTIF